MFPLIIFINLCLFPISHLSQSESLELNSVILSLSEGLESNTNLIYTDDTQSSQIATEIAEIIDRKPSILVHNNLSRLIQSCVNPHRPLLVIMPQLETVQILEFFERIPVKMQQADFLIVGRVNATKWLQMLSMLWHLGYPNILMFNITHTEGTTRGDLYSSDAFPLQELQATSIDHYLWSRRHWFDNLQGWEVRVGLYNNPPRTLVYPDDGIYDGYALMLLREFLTYRGAKFVPVLTPDYKVYSPNDCLNLLRNNETDLCGDLFAYNYNYSFTDSYMYLYGNILVRTGQPRSKNYYIVAPLQLKTWLLLGLYVLVICSFASFICWLQTGRIEFGTLLFQILSSFLSEGCRLREIVGRLHYILFSIISLAGFICSNCYLAFLKSLLSTGVYGPQIDSFEELVRQNVSIIVGDYDKTVLKSYDYPDILWNVTRVVPYDFILKHRRVFDTNYAYLAHSDRLVLFKFQQQYMRKPRMRPLTIDLMHSLPGFPMRAQWLLKFKLSEALLNCFNSGLMDKLAADTNRQTIHIGYLSLIPSEQYEARPLTLDYFAMPLNMLILGVILAFASLLCELLWNRFRARNRN